MFLIRQLAAVMFTDIVGYTTLMREDEKKALNILQENRELQQPIIKRFNGKWIKEMGDGVLASFNTVTDALLCAMAIQHGCTDLAAFKLRIGIHLGEIIFEDDDVFGDAVNIASRIQALAPVGGIWISEAVNEIIVNKKEFKTKFVQKELLKNVKEPVSIYELAIDNVFEEPSSLYISLKKFDKSLIEKSVAVLPFANMSNDPDQEYFGDGIAEEIINSLTHIQDLKVAGRMSSFQFKGINADLRDIGKKLNVRTVLQGSIRKQGNMLRVTAQLINVEDGFHLWSEKYDRNVDDIFAIQDDIALAITEKLKVSLLKTDLEKITKSHTQNPFAYELYLKGRFFLYRRGTSIITAIQYFQQAIEADPDFALAYAGLADANLLLATYGLASPRQVVIKAKKSAEKSLTLDPTLCEPYAALGYYYTTYEWNWHLAKKNFLKSLELNPQYCQAHSWYGWNYLAWVEGKFEEAIKHGEILIKVEPLSATFYGSYSLILHTANKLEKALAICKMGIELDPTAFLCRLNEGYIYTAMQQYEKAISSYEAAMKISNNHHYAVNGLIQTYCMIGNYEQASGIMEELKKRSNTEYIANTFTGLSAAHLKNLDEAFMYLEKGFEEREPLILSLKYEKWGTAELRNDPRFQNLLDRVGFPNQILQEQSYS